MKYLTLLLIICSVTANGWETSRFFIRMNGTTVGEQSIREWQEGDTVITESRSHMTLKRGGRQLKMAESSRQKSRADGTPLSLNYQFEQAGMTLACKARFNPETVQLSDGTLLALQADQPVRLDYGTRLKVQHLIENPDTPLTFLSFSPTTRQLIERSIRYAGMEEKGERKLHRITMTDRVAGVKLEQKLITDNRGRTLKSTSTVMGLTIETVSTDWSSDTRTEPEAPDILVQTLFPATHPFPSGTDIRQLTFRVNGLPTAMSIPDGPWQQVERHPDHLLIQVSRPDIRLDMKGGQYPEALADSPVVQTGLAAIRETANRLRKEAPEDGAYAMAVIDHVYHFINRKGYGIGFGDTAAILEKREGDCTEHTVLAMALLRAGGIPARAAMGLVSMNSFMGYHMWVEAFLDDRWIPMDPTFRQYRADASHIRLGSSLINDPGFQRDLYPIAQMLSELSVEPVEAVRIDGSRISRFDPFVLEDILHTPFGNFTPGEPFQWTPEPPGTPTDMRKLGRITLNRDGLRIDLALADVKEIRDTVPLIRQLGARFSPLSFETLHGEPVSVGTDGERLTMFIVRDDTLLQFTFAGPSDTIMETMKERAYDICLNLLSYGKGTDSDRR